MVDQADHPKAAGEEPDEYEVPVQTNLQSGSAPKWLQKTGFGFSLQQHLQTLQVGLDRITKQSYLCPTSTWYQTTYRPALVPKPEVEAPHFREILFYIFCNKCSFVFPQGGKFFGGAVCLRSSCNFCGKPGSRTLR